MEQLKKQSYKVLFLVKSIDEYAVQQLKEFDGHKLVSVTKKGLKLPKDKKEKQKREETKKGYENLTKVIKDTLGDKVEKVILGFRVLDSPCVLIIGEFGWFANMERVMKVQALQNSKLMLMKTIRPSKILFG